MPKKWKKIDLFDANLGDIVGAIDGPGQHPAYLDEDHYYEVIEKCETPWGKQLKVKNRKTHREETVHSFTDIGIGWYYMGRGEDIKDKTGDWKWQDTNGSGYWYNIETGERRWAGKGDKPKPLKSKIKKCRDAGGRYKDYGCEGINKRKCQEIGGKWSARSEKCKL